MGSAAGQPNYTKFQVIKRIKGGGTFNDKIVDIKGKVVGFNYYESLYSPMVTASFLEVDTGGTVEAKDDFAATLKDGLPVEGFEEVLVKVSSKYRSLDWRGKKRRFIILFNIIELNNTCIRQINNKTRLIFNCRCGLGTNFDLINAIFFI